MAKSQKLLNPYEVPEGANTPLERAQGWYGKKPMPGHPAPGGTGFYRSGNVMDGAGGANGGLYRRRYPPMDFDL